MTSWWSDAYIVLAFWPTAVLGCRVQDQSSWFTHSRWEAQLWFYFKDGVWDSKESHFKLLQGSNLGSRPLQSWTLNPEPWTPNSGPSAAGPTILTMIWPSCTPPTCIRVNCWAPSFSLGFRDIRLTVSRLQLSLGFGIQRIGLRVSCSNLWDSHLSHSTFCHHISLGLKFQGSGCRKEILV